MGAALTVGQSRCIYELTELKKHCPPDVFYNSRAHSSRKFL
jgi:hypothetical protein